MSENKQQSSSFASTSLYVGDLANDVTEANLFEIFNQIGAVASIRVCRDAITRRSLGYAYVNFHNSQDAERAIDTLNNQPIKGRPCRVMWSQRDPSLRKSGKGNIFIKNLDKSIDHKALYDTFIQFGQIVSCKIELDDKNESKGYGYIQYATQEAADKAIQRVNNMMLAGKKVYVGPFVGRKERLTTANTKQFTNVFFKNLEESVDENELKNMVSAFGTVKSIAIMRDEAGKSKGFGFVNFDLPEEAEKAVKELNEKDIRGKVVFVGRAQKKHEREMELRQKFELLKLEHINKYQGVNLYIKNLDDDLDDQKLRTIFDPFGTITSAKVMRDSKINSKGFGFVCFSTPEEATKAVTEMNGKIVGSKPLYVALAQRKEIRKAQLEAQFAQRTKALPRMPAPMYNGGPMFYPPGQPGFVYPPQMVPRGRYPQGFPTLPPNYVVVGGRGQVKNARGGVMGGRGRGGMKQVQPQIPVVVPPTVVGTIAPETTALTAQVLSRMPIEEQKRILGDRLYPLISKFQPQLAGKITGMILESSYNEEMLHLIDDANALNEKIEEAMKVLREHTDKPPATKADGQE